MTPRLGIELGPHRLEASTLSTAPALLLKYIGLKTKLSLSLDVAVVDLKVPSVIHDKITLPRSQGISLIWVEKQNVLYPLAGINNKTHL